MNIRQIGFLDVSTCMAGFVRLYQEKLKPDGDGLETFLLRSAEADAPILREWASARKLLARLKNEAAPFLNGKPATLGKAMVTRLKPGSHTPWSFDDSDYGSDHLRLHICLIPSPMAFLYSGGEMANPAVGVVTYFNTQVLHSEVNIGPCSRVALVVDVKRPDSD